MYAAHKIGKNACAHAAEGPAGASALGGQPKHFPRNLCCTCCLTSQFLAALQVVAVMGCMKGITLQLKILTWPALVRGLTSSHRPLTCD